MELTGRQNGALSFEIKQDSFTYTVDASPGSGGEGKGPTPKGLLLGGLIGCTGMDVADILRKMKQSYRSFELTASADQTSEEPKVFKTITLVYTIHGDDVDPDKVVKAVRLSQDKYCGVSAMLRKNSPIDIKIVVNGREIAYSG